jgi:hypothetical protein
MKDVKSRLTSKYIYKIVERGLCTAPLGVQKLSSVYVLKKYYSNTGYIHPYWRVKHPHLISYTRFNILIIFN